VSVQLNQHQAVQSERSLEVVVLEGSCFWGVEDPFRDDTRTLSAAAAALTAVFVLFNRSFSIYGRHQ